MLLAKNRKALFNYEVIDKYTAGIVLTGYEAKAVREKHVSFEGAFVKILDGIIYVENLNISRYSKQGSDVNYSPTRPRRLLLNKREIDKIKSDISQKGKTAVPLALILKNNMVKLELAVVKGKKKHEKKQVAKEKQIQKDLENFTKDIKKSIWN